MFIDEAEIYAQSGKGGDGFMHFHQEKFVFHAIRTVVTAVRVRSDPQSGSASEHSGCLSAQDPLYR